MISSVVARGDDRSIDKTLFAVAMASSRSAAARNSCAEFQSALRRCMSVSSDADAIGASAAGSVAKSTAGQKPTAKTNQTVGLRK
jgi:hypothetical protein